VHPNRKRKVWYFEEIDIARLQLICHLTQDIEVNDEGMDIVLSLLDQLYGTRAHVQKLTHAIAQQPQQVQTDILMIIKESLRIEKP
jgi:chaperone modulatory protein CbpM